jgi:hypothetical protein
MSEEYEKKIKKISQLLIENPERMIKEKDLITFVQDANVLEEMISDLVSRFEKIGYDILKTRFINDTFYLLTTEGIDKKLTPQMYGILALIIGLSKELGKEMKISDAQNIFSEIWDEANFLIENKYLNEIKMENDTYLVAGPIAKAVFKNFINEISFEKIMENLGIKK